MTGELLEIHRILRSDQRSAQLTCGTFHVLAAARWFMRWMRFSPYEPLLKILGDVSGSRELRLK